MKILFIDTVHPYLWNSLQEAGHECVEGYTLSRGWITQQVSFYDGLVIRSRIQLDKILSAAHRLRFIARAGAGMESIDVEVLNQKTLHAWTPRKAIVMQWWACSQDVTVINE